MQRSKRMQPVLDQTQREEAAAREALAQAQQALTEAIQQVNDLEAYEQDYMSQMRNHSQSIRTASTYHSYHTFLTKLALAIRQQVGLVELREKQQAKCLLDWQASKSRLSNMESFIQRIRAEEDAAADKKLQQQLDEMSLQRFIARQRKPGRSS
ncbi:MAG: flagellar export protein FliJ [unclassified Hahellaceae]|nr:flagellar export protein FliJ [Hahellaceae bacterium]|tara:strand:+ start:69769 stop:70230 length:462 start_codon:yes stop_codon:yes gene_type:complete